MCRYNGKKLEKAVLPLRNTRYIAISHVWGKSAWRFIPDVPGRVLSSNKKAKFIATELRRIVNGSYFWMDILCVDQSNKGARIAITQLIPDIFRNAERTIFVRDGDGARECCASALDDCSSSRFSSFSSHWMNFHRNELPEERVLSRLRVFQETILSDTIEFVSCDNVAQAYPELSEKDQRMEVDRFDKHFHSLADAWAASANGLSRELLSQKFKIAFLNNTTISRTTPTTKTYSTLLGHDDFAMQIDCARSASEPRDFILATAPHNGFYRVPENARHMTFSELFSDYIHQYEKEHGHRVRPLYTGESKLSLADLATGSLPASIPVPEPTCLGDLVKLFQGPILAAHVDFLYTAAVPQFATAKNDNSVTLRHIDRRIQCRAYRVKVSAVSIPTAIMDLVDLTLKTFSYSDLLWYSSMNELHHVQMQSKFYRTEWRSIMNTPSEDTLGVMSLLHDLAHDLFALGKPEKVLAKWRIMCEHGSVSFNIEGYATLLVQMIALISCGFGVSALEWSFQNLLPVHVEFRGRLYFAMVPTWISPKDTGFDFYLAEARGEGERYALLARHREHLLELLVDVVLQKCRKAGFGTHGPV